MKWLLILFLLLENTAFANREGNGGNTFQIQLERARDSAIAFLRSNHLSTGDLRKDPHFNHDWQKWMAQAPEIASTAESMTFKFIYPSNGDKPIYVNGSRMEALAYKGIAEIIVDVDLVSNHSIIRLAALLIHESLHVMGYGSEYEKSIDRFSHAVVDYAFGIKCVAKDEIGVSSFFYLPNTLRDAAQPYPMGVPARPLPNVMQMLWISIRLAEAGLDPVIQIEIRGNNIQDWSRNEWNRWEDLTLYQRLRFQLKNENLSWNLPAFAKETSDMRLIHIFCEKVTSVN